MLELSYTAEAKSRIKRLNIRVKRQLEKALGRISGDPALGKRLTGELSGFVSYRLGDYRVLYKVFHSENKIIVMTVGHRKDVYKKII